MKKLQLFILFTIGLITTSCCSQKTKSTHTENCSEVLTSISSKIHNNNEGRLNSTLNISNFLLKNKNCLIGKNRDEIINILGTPVEGIEIQQEAFLLNISYVTSQECNPENKICKQVLFRVNSKSNTVSDMIIILVQ